MTLFKFATATLISGLVIIAAPATAQQTLPGHEAAAGEDRRALSPAGPLQGNWRVVRAGDPADSAIMGIQIIHDGSRLEGSYVLYQPFCSIERPLPVVGDEDCEFIGLGGQITAGQSRGRWASVILRPGADGLDHRIRFRNHPASGPLTGRYHAPGDRSGVPVILERAPE